mgnify:CR=1 FL=1
MAEILRQPALDGAYTVFGRVVGGLDVVQAISALEADANGQLRGRVVIKAVTIRDTPPPPVPPFSRETPAELAAYRLVLEISAGEIEMEFLTAIAPEQSSFTGGGAAPQRHLPADRGQVRAAAVDSRAAQLADKKPPTWVFLMTPLNAQSATKIRSRSASRAGTREGLRRKRG